MKTLIAAPMAALLLCGCAATASPPGTPVASEPAAKTVEPSAADGEKAVLDTIWAKEMAIYEGRAEGDLTYYLDNASPRFLAWVSGTKVPFRKETLAASGREMKGRGEEVITTELMDFSLSGDTAIIYYRNHRTKLPDGTEVEQFYDNIHVWQRTDGVWMVLASMSRHAE